MAKTFDIGGEIVSAEERSEIRAGFIGCGNHAFRNVYPTLQFAPVDLIATCDLDREKASMFAKQFGAERSYQDHNEMLAEEDLDAVFVIVGYGEGGRPLYPPVAKDVLRSGNNVWIEKPPAATTDEIRELIEVEKETGQFVHVGFKKVYNPAVEKAKEITNREEFGATNTIYVRYPEGLPDRENPHDSLTHDGSLLGFLDHLVHPASIISYLGGSMDSATCSASDEGGGFITVEFSNGTLGTIHMAAGDSGSSPLERIEVIGEGANVVVDNGITLEYYPPYNKGPYGRTTTFMNGDGDPPIRWTPEFSLGQLYNKNLFTLGYYNEITDFAESCLEDERPEKSGTEMALEVMKLYEAVLEGEGRRISL